MCLESARYLVFMFLLIRLGVWYLSFSPTVFIAGGNCCLCFFLVSWFNFYCHYYFHYLCFLPYKKPPFDFCQPSTKKIKSTISINNNGTFTEHTWATSAKNRRKLSMRKSWDLLLLKWVYGIFWNLSVNLFCVFQRGTVKNVVWILS